MLVVRYPSYDGKYRRWPLKFHKKNRNRKLLKINIRTIVNHESTIRMFECCVCCKNRIVWFNNSSWDLRSWINCKFEFWFLAIVDTKSLHQQWCETWASTTLKKSNIFSLKFFFIRIKHTAKAVKDEKTLETSTLIGQFTNTIEYKINDFLSNCIMATSIVVSYT